MKKITLMLLAVVLTFVGVGGAKAERVNGNLYAIFGANWDSSTNTMSWSATSGYTIIGTGFSGGDISKYTHLHAILSDFSENANFIRLRIKDTSAKYADYRLVEGENFIDLTTHATLFPSCDFTSIEDITIWGADAATEGKTIDNDHPASVKITDVYMDTTDAPFVSTVSNGFGEKITSVEDITDGTKFVIGDGGTNVLYWITSSVDNQKADVKSVPYDSYYYFTLEQVEGLDTDGDEIVENDNYRIKIVNASGNAFTHAWNLGSYLNYSQWGHLFAGSGKSKEEGGANNYGGDGDYYAIWKVAYSEGNGFTLKNAGVNKYAKVTGTSESVVYLNFYKSIDFTSRTMYPANDEIFALSKATGYNATTGEMTNGTWTFDTPVDLSKWKYFIIAMENGCADGSHEVSITDNNNVTVKGDTYVGTDAGTGPNMWLSRWNHQNIGCFNLDYLKNTLGLDIENIKSLSIAGTTKPFAVYLSCYDNSKLLTTNRWACYKEGDLVRTYAQADAGKFGTVCLPYKASVAGAEVYSIASANESTITLTKVNGLLEAGKPYFYKASDSVGKDNEGTICNVNFFRTDFDKYDASIPITSNGLIGTFTAIEAVPQGDDIFVLSSNKLYQVNSAVSLAANRAYVDKSQITNTQATSRTISLAFDDATAIDNMQVVNEIANQAIYNLSGQRVAQPTKGLYIVNGKKVIIK